MQDDLESLLLQSAHLNAQIRKRLIQSDRPSNAKLFTYVLLLQNNNIYVGSTSNVFVRFHQHFYDTEYASKWVREHSPVLRVLEVVRNSSAEDEVYKTLEYMSVYGHESVRGGHWTNVDMKNPPQALHKFVRNRCDFEYMSREDIDKATNIARDLHDIVMAA